MKIKLRMMLVENGTCAVCNSNKDSNEEKFTSKCRDSVEGERCKHSGNTTEWHGQMEEVQFNFIS